MGDKVIQCICGVGAQVTQPGCPVCNPACELPNTSLRMASDKILISRERTVQGQRMTTVQIEVRAHRIERDLPQLLEVMRGSLDAKEAEFNKGKIKLP